MTVGAAWCGVLRKQREAFGVCVWLISFFSFYLDLDLVRGMVLPNFSWVFSSLNVSGTFWKCSGTPWTDIPGGVPCMELRKPRVREALSECLLLGWTQSCQGL